MSGTLCNRISTSLTHQMTSLCAGGEPAAKSKQSLANGVAQTVSKAASAVAAPVKAAAAAVGLTDDARPSTAAQTQPPGQPSAPPNIARSSPFAQGAAPISHWRGSDALHKHLLLTRDALRADHLAIS